MDPLINALGNEIEMRKDEIRDPIDTIYFGGGTPSLLSPLHLEFILSKIQKYYTLSESPEMTIECNPDDITAENLKTWQKAGLNRISLGLQSFDDAILKWMNRSHSSEQGLRSYQLARDKGFDNISIDLIYGVPSEKEAYWQEQLDLLSNLDPDHISAYCLTIEKRTVFHKQYSEGLFKLPSETLIQKQFKALRKTLIRHGYLHYEVSNFGKANYISRHNSAYWKDTTYLGFGPSAHSYVSPQRRWNINNNNKYIQSVQNNQPYFETEILSKKEMFNEMIMTKLRTMWGVSRSELENFPPDYYSYFKKQIKHYEKYLLKNKTHYVLNEQGMLIADRISSDLFIVD